MFCTNPEEPLTFRKAKHSDYLGSPLRRHILSGLETREVKLDALMDHSGNYIVTDERNPLGKLQEEQGAHHWEGMLHLPLAFKFNYSPECLRSDADSLAQFPLGNVLEYSKSRENGYCITRAMYIS